MSGSVTASPFIIAPTTDPSVTHYSFDNASAGYEASGPQACITAMDNLASIRGDGLNRCDDAEMNGLVNAVTYTAAAGLLGKP